MTFVYGLYHNHPDTDANTWDLRGIYATHLEALDAMTHLLDTDSRLVRDDFAIDEIKLGQALS